MSYQKLFEFSDGSKGEIYNIERNDNSVKVYFKGNSEKASLLMGTFMTMKYAATDSNSDSNVLYSSEDMSLYKDPNNALGYVVEFDNVGKDRALELSIDKGISKIDKFKIGDIIQISK